MPHNNQKKVAVINDFSGFGRCSIAVSMPIFSAMKMQCCPLPTAIFSNHTGFDSFFMTDYTDHMAAYMDEWKKLDLKFNAINTGFLASTEQIDLCLRFMEMFKTEDTLAVIDPVMGDYGKLYQTYTEDLAKSMRKLATVADILTPNLTEACVLADRPYSDNLSENDLLEICEKLHEMGANKIVISGLDYGDYLGNYVFEAGKKPLLLTEKRTGPNRSGTGDVYSAIITADAVNGLPFENSVRRASAFVAKAIARSEEMKIPVTDGIAFEELLGDLI